MRKWIAALAALLVVLALPAVASAKRRTYKVDVGNAGKQPATLAPGTVSLNKFFPGTIKIRKGDRVRYRFYGPVPHTASVLASGQTTAPGPVTPPDPANGVYSGIVTPNGSPYVYLNGKPKAIYDPGVWQPSGSTRIGNGQFHGSGAVFPGQNGPGKYTYKFTRKGTYRVYCLILPGMRETVKVLKKRSKKADRPSKVRSRALKQLSRAYADAVAAKGTTIPPVSNGAGTVAAGLEKRRASLLVFAPNSVTIPVGGTVTWQNMAPTEIHNMVFRPTPAAVAYDDNVFSKYDQVPVFGNPVNQVDPALAFGSQHFGNQTGYDGQTLNGTGFLETPVLDDDATTAVPASSVRIRFTRAGTYPYYCRIHGKSMSGTVIVK